jgi:hypothetical protein
MCSCVVLVSSPLNFVKQYPKPPGIRYVIEIHLVGLLVCPRVPHRSKPELLQCPSYLLSYPISHRPFLKLVSPDVLCVGSRSPRK